jgi:glyoxylase-like metal-dependent hydrolase (beta-lactamase superfamily II)
MARQLGEKLGLPVLELDAVFHAHPNWVDLSAEEFREQVAAYLASHPAGWVIDGNYAHVRDLVLAKAETAIWLKLPFRTVYRRLAWRTVTRSITGGELWNGNKESMKQTFLTKDSMLVWGVVAWSRHHRQVHKSLVDGQHAAQLYRLRTPGQVRYLLENATLAPAWATIPSSGGSRMETVRDGDLEIVMAGPTGFGNNVYVVVDRATNEAAFIDAPGEPAVNAAAAESAGVKPSKILLTHGHGAHTPAIDALKQQFGSKLFADGAEPGLKDGQLDAAVKHGDEVKVGNLAFRVLSVPGHTPGSTTFVCGKHAFVGDTLFPGGPGRSRDNAALQQEIASIVRELFALPDDTTVWPGHGAITTIGASKAEYAVFAAKDHAPDLCGDVNWLES